MKDYRLEAHEAVEVEIEAAFEWYEAEELNLGFQFLEQLRVTYTRILDNPHAYQDIRSGIRRALIRQFPYAVYFAIKSDTILVLAVLHAARDPEKWQQRI